MVGDAVVALVPCMVLVGAAAGRRAWLRAGPARAAATLGSGPVSGAARLVRRRSAARSGAEDLHRLRSALTGGASLRGALESVASGGGPWAVSARRVVARAEAGQRLDHALDAWAAEHPDPTVGLLVDALVMVNRTGASHHRAVGAVAEVVHGQEAIADEIRSVTAQARASAVVLVATPLGFAVLLAVVDGRVRTFFGGSWLGLGCILSGLGLDAVGAWWMRRVVGSVR